LLVDASNYIFTYMDSFIPNYKALTRGGIIAILLTFVLGITGFIIFDPDYIFLNIFGFVIGWLFISFLTYKFPIYKIVGVFGLLVAAVLAERYMKMPINPIAIPLIILFWLGVAYIILPEFFKKYKLIILSFYGLILSYFLFFRMSPNYLEDHHSNFISFLLIPIPVLVAFWVYEQWRWLKTLKADKTKGELALLKSQVNPHFFFNTLNNLYGLVVEKSEKAPEVILKLSDMMRYTIYEGKEELVLLEDEICYLENYIELHKIRYQKKVEISFIHDVKKGIKVAPLLFINLLENAFKHGVEKILENAFIHLKMQVRGNKLFFKIENKFAETSSPSKNGIGLENLEKRLDYLYPNKHELIIEEKGSVYKVQLNLELK